MTHDTMSIGNQQQQTGACVMAICQKCGAAFAARRRGVKYCSQTCQKRAHWKLADCVEVR